MSRLFDEPEQAKAVAVDAAARVVGVAVGANVWGTFDYVWPEGLGEPVARQRVRVPFGRGNKKTVGFVVDTLRRPERKELKAVAEVVDQVPQFDECLWRLGEWISDYYLSPLGVTLAAMIPSAVGRHASRTESVVLLTSAPADWQRSLGARQRRVLDELYEADKQGVESLSLAELLRRSGAARHTVQRLVKRELVKIESRPVRLPELGEGGQGDPFELNEDQAAAVAGIGEKLDAGFSTTLLHGVTGSGKTEVYVRVIREVIAAGRQAILLVPEIALATQTLERLLARLPRVAVLHSALTDAQRAFYYEQIREGHADVVVGPRSAIFAPTRNLAVLMAAYVLKENDAHGTIGPDPSDRTAGDCDEENDAPD